MARNIGFTMHRWVAPIDFLRPLSAQFVISILRFAMLLDMSCAWEECGPVQLHSPTHKSLINTQHSG
jgi:hypothetical protein